MSVRLRVWPSRCLTLRLLLLRQSWLRAAAAVALLALNGCSSSVLDSGGPVGAANAEILLNALAIMLVIVVPTIVGTLAFAFWYRASNSRARYLPYWAFSGRIELIVWGIPLLVIMFLGGVIWIGSHKLDPYRPLAASGKPLEVQVVSLDWKWLFIYPDHGIASVNQLVIPTGVPVHFSLTSASVMNAFFVPRLGSMIATMNGMVTQLFLQADEAGDYYGLSTQYSGDGFSGMHFTLRAVPQAAFAPWVSSVQAVGQTLDNEAYMALAKQSQNVAPFTYRAIQADLFHAVVTQELPPGPGPQTGRGSRSVRPEPEH